MQPLILVVDDDPSMLSFIERVLRDEAVEVWTAAEPAAALQRIAGRTPDLLLLDLKLPGVPGLDLVHLLRGAALTPAIAMTGGDVSEDTVRANGFSQLLRKPFHPAELRRAVRDHLPAPPPGRGGGDRTPSTESDVMTTQTYRVTLRYGPARLYHIMDVPAESLRDALAGLVAEYPAFAEDADLMEIRLQVEAERRPYTME
jgi:DNA-binding response OmpR family regulator